MTKTLQESANELEASLNRFSKARRDFMKAYQESVIDILIDEELNRDMFKETFGEKLDGGYGQSM